MAQRKRKLVNEIVGGEPYEYYPLGQHIVAAPGVCGGRPTFKYTRIDVRFILGRIAGGEDPARLVAAYRDRFSMDALEEAKRLEDEHGPDFFEREFDPPNTA